MKRVLLAGNYRPDRQFSMLGFETALAKHVPKERVLFTAIHPAQVLGGGNNKSFFRKWFAYADKFVLFPKKLRQLEREVDLVHIVDHGNAMWVPSLKKRPVLVTCHDLLAMRASLGEIPEWSVGGSGRKFQTLIAQGLALSSHIACVSRATRGDLCRILKFPPEQSSVIYNGLYDPCIGRLEAHEIRSRIGDLQLKWSEGFLLHVGGNQPYKYRTGLLDIYSLLTDRMGERCPGLVLAGHRLNEDVRERHKVLFDTGKVIEVVTPDTRTIWALYSAARGLVFPSLLEGFGLPLLEAQACGCPVFSSNRASLPEVGGRGALYFDPENHEEAVDAILAGLRDPMPLIQEGYANLTHFTTERMVSEYVELYESLCA